jgi:O-antigen/teichoic acid export membrane protein
MFLKLKKFHSIGFSIFIKFFAIGLGVYTSRWLNVYLEPSQLKDFNLILVYNAVIFGILHFGLPNFVQKFYINTKDKSNYKTFWSTILYFQILLYLVGLAIVFVIYLNTNIATLQVFIALFTAQYILLVDTNFKSIADAHNKSWLFSLSDLFAKALVIICLFIASQFPALNFLVYLSWTLLGVYILEFSLDWFLQKESTPLGKPDFTIITKNLGFFWYLGAANFLGGISSTTDRWFLDYFKYSPTIINGYSNAYKILEISLIPQAIAIPVLLGFCKKEIDAGFQPKIFKSYIANNFWFSDKISKLSFETQTLLKWVIANSLIGLITGVLVMLLGWVGILIIDPQKRYFQEAVGVLPILGIALFPSGFIGFAGGMTVLFEKEKYELWGYFVFALTSILLYIMLIPPFGEVGAAWSSFLVGIVFAAFKANFLIKSYIHYKNQSLKLKV